jgi:hypothetical protein
MNPVATPPIARRQSRRALQRLYRDLPPSTVDALVGVHRGEIIGPAWQQPLVEPSFWICRLRGWWGKRIVSPTENQNIILRQGQYRRTLPMLLETRPSYLDRAPALHVIYPPGSPYPWPTIIDELRRIDARTCLGMTIFTPLRLQVFAFLLTAVDEDPTVPSQPLR